MNPIQSPPDQGVRLKLEQVSQKKGGKVILNGLNLQVAPNLFVGLLGPSGSGKSTLLKACCGLDKPQGVVRWNHDELYKDLKRWREKMGYVPQDDIIHQDLSVDKAVTYAARLRLAANLKPATRDALVTRVIHEVGLQDRRNVKIKRLSGGQRKRASVAVELLNRPEILFLDEPTSGQDPQLEASMMQLFRNLSRQGTTVLVTTHAMASVELLDRVIVLNAGHLAFMGPPDDMLTFFKSRSYEGVYRVLAQSQPGEWARAYQQSEFATYARA